MNQQRTLFDGDDGRPCPKCGGLVREVDVEVSGRCLKCDADLIRGGPADRWETFPDYFGVSDKPKRRKSKRKSPGTARKPRARRAKQLT